MVMESPDSPVVGPCRCECTKTDTHGSPSDGAIAVIRRKNTVAGAWDDRPNEDKDSSSGVCPVWDFCSTAHWPRNPGLSSLWTSVSSSEHCR